MMVHTRNVPVMVCALLAFAATCLAQQTQTVILIDGSGKTGKLTGLDAKGARLTIDDKTVETPIAELQEVAFGEAAPDAAGRAGQAIIVTRRGSRIAANAVSLADGKLSFDTLPARRASLDIEAVSILALPTGRLSAQAVLDGIKELKFNRTNVDYLVTMPKSGSYVPVPGVLKGIDTGRISFSYEGTASSMPRERVPLIRIAALGKAPAKPKGYVLLTDGSRLVFDSAELADDTLRLDGACLGKLAVKLPQVSRVVYRNENVAYLDEMQPESVKQAGTFDRTIAHRVNESTTGKPLTLDGKKFSRGLGMHSRCELTYALDRSYRTLLALAGIDDAARPAGDVALSVLGDGKVLLAPLTITGQDKARPIRVDVAGVKKLTILVDFGESLDVGDHLDLADAKLIK